MATIQKQWDYYDRRVLPYAASSVQRQECRRAFYAGVQAMFAIMRTVGDDERITEDDGVRLFEAIEQELMTFVELVKAGIL